PTSSRPALKTAAAPDAPPPATEPRHRTTPHPTHSAHSTPTRVRKLPALNPPAVSEAWQSHSASDIPTASPTTPLPSPPAHPQPRTKSPPIRASDTDAYNAPASPC